MGFYMSHTIPSREWTIDRRLDELIAELATGTITPAGTEEMQHLSAERSRLMTRKLFGNRRRGLHFNPSLTVRKKRHG